MSRFSRKETEIAPEEAPLLINAAVGFSGRVITFRVVVDRLDDDDDFEKSRRTHRSGVDDGAFCRRRV